MLTFTNVDTFSQDKLCELKLRLSIMDNKPKVITISEVNKKNFKLERFLSEYNIDEYEMIPLNLNKGDPGRGMILYIDSNLKYTR